MGDKFYSTDQLNKNIEESKLLSHRCSYCGELHQIEACPLKHKDMPCLRCDMIDHNKKPGRPTRVNEKSGMEMRNAITSVNDKMLNTGRYFSSLRLRLDHGSTVIKAVICTGTKHSFMRRSKFMELDYTPTRREPSTAERMFGTEVNTLGSYELHMNIGYEGHYIQCHILNDDLLPEEMVLGMNFVSGVEIVIKNCAISVRKTIKTADENQHDTAVEL